MATKKLCTIDYSGAISELGGLMGPITSPTLIPVTDIVSLINKKRVVYEVNPNDYNEKVLLTRANVHKTNFTKCLAKSLNVTTTEEVTPVVASVEETTKETKKSKAVKITTPDFN